MTQGSIFPTSPVEGRSLFRSGSASVTFGGVTYNRPGASTDWIGVVAYDPTEPDAVQWIAGLGLTGTSTWSRYTENIWHDDNGDTYLAVSVRPNHLGSSAFTLGAYDTNEALIVSADTFNNINGLGTGHFECFLAKFNPAGVPQWIKRVANVSVASTDNSNCGQPYAVDGTLSDRVLLVLRCQEGTAGAASVSKVFGPGDANEETYTTRSDKRHWAIASIRKIDGALINLEVGDTTDAFLSYHPVPNAQISSTRRFTSAVTNRSVIISNISNNVMTPVLRANTGTPTSIPSPGSTDSRVHFGVYDPRDWSQPHPPQAGGNRNNLFSDSAALACALDDGKTLWAGSFAAGNLGVDFTTQGGANFNRSDFDTDDQPFFSFYNSDGSVDWIKRLDKQNGAEHRVFFNGHLDDIENDRIVLAFYTLTLTGTLTFGPGETGERTWTSPSANQHGGFICVRRTTGDLLWVNTIEDVTGGGGANAVPGPLRLDGNVVRSTTQIFGDIRFDEINTGTLVNFGANRLVVNVLHDVGNGAYLGYETALSANANVLGYRPMDLIGDV